MSLPELLLLSVSLAMDAFAVSVCAGITEKKHSSLKAMRPAGMFAVFQIGMPLLGYALGSAVAGAIGAVGQYVAALLLAIIGGKMIWDAVKGDDDDCVDVTSTLKLLLMAVATSIDALAAGVSLSFLKVNIWLSALTIGVITFIICLTGYYLGGRIGGVFQKRAVIIGGVVLALLGVKIFVESFI